MNHDFNDPEFAKHLDQIRRENPETFLDLVLQALKAYPEFALEDIAPENKKLSALQRMLEYYERIENYEDCDFILKLKERIQAASTQDGKKD